MRHGAGIEMKSRLDWLRRDMRSGAFQEIAYKVAQLRDSTCIGPRRSVRKTHFLPSRQATVPDICQLLEIGG